MALDPARGGLERTRNQLKREETGGFTTLITGIALQHRDDTARLEAGTVMLDAFHRALQQRTRK